ncbi:hypothetical protein [Thermoactinospora rubra]|uniref:hypothetical protein n=1 Tax=Thermoactinospora rubra TaxID=1088767 RepID=UPI00117F105E|nr:hypothetical protein [Thermoactinospora rubra]
MSIVSMGVAGVGFLLQLAALVTGIVLTLRARRSHGRAAVLGATGCVVLLLGVIVSLLPSLFARVIIEAFGFQATTSLFMLTSLLHTLLFVAGVGLLVAGVVTPRTAPAPYPGPHPGHYPGPPPR